VYITQEVMTPQQPATADSIGSFSGGSGYFDGNISKTRIYNRTISQEEITEIYNTEKVDYE